MLRRKQGLPLWLLSLTTLLLVGGWIGWNSYEDYQATMEREYTLLEVWSHDRGIQIKGLVRSAEVMMLNIEDDLADEPLQETPRLNALLKSRVRQLPETRALVLTDRSGIIIGSSVETSIGFDTSKRDYFMHLRDDAIAHPDTHPLFITKPFKTASGVPNVSIVRTVHDAAEKFNGVMIASIGLEKFGELLASVESPPDEEALVVHESGDVIYSLPHPEKSAGKNLVGGIAFTEHIRSGQATTRHHNVTKNSGIDMISVFSRIPGTPLIVISSRPYATIISQWRGSLITHLGGFAVIACFLLFMTRQVERRQAVLKKQEDKFRTVADYTYGWETWEAPQGGYLYVSPSCKRISGYTREEFLADPALMDRIVLPEDVEKWATHRQQTKLNIDAHATTFRIRCKDDSVRWIEHLCSPVVDGQGQYLGRRGSNRDVSEMKEAEADLLKAKEAAELANRAKASFLANMSHEIRTPLNAIIGLTHLLLDGILTEQQRDYLTKVYRSSRALLNVLNDILDYSKIEAGQLQIEHIPFNLEDTFKQVGDLFMVQVEKKSLELFFDIDHRVPHTLVGDPLRIAQVLNNLLSNAIKFTERGEIHVKSTLLEQTSTEVLVCFSVRDTGIGIPADALPSLFAPFIQADSSTTRKHGGTGLGLAITKQLIELMEGEISVVSQPNDGSTFTFTVRFGVAAVAHAEPTDLSQLHGMRVLVVDDQDTSRLVLQAYLESWKFDVATAASGQEALDKIEQAEKNGCMYELLLLDWKMPGMDGLELAALLQNRNARTQPAPMVIMVTGYALEDLRANMGATRIDAVLLKPVVPSELFNVISDVKKVTKRSDVRRSNAPTVRQASSAIRGARLLLVEDNALNQEVACEFLRRAGFIVVTANNGEESIDLVKQQSFDAVLMDIHMPVMDGLEATRQIRLLPQGKDIPIIALSAAAMGEDLASARLAGMNAHVAKPIDPNQLIAVLEEWVQHGVRDMAPAPMPPDQNIASPSLNTLPGLDITAATERVAGNQQLLAKLLLRFAEDFADASIQIEKLLQDGNTTGATELLHRIAGVAFNLGATDLGTVTRRFENEVRSGSELLSRPDFTQTLSTTIDTIRTHIRPPEEAPPATQSTLDPLAMRRQLEQLADRLREYEVPARETLTNVYTQLTGYVAQPQLLALEEQIERYDFVSAVASIETILESLTNE